MKRNRIFLPTSLVVLTLVAITIGLFRARTATAQLTTRGSGIPEIVAAPVPKTWGRVVGSDSYPTGGGALIFEAANGTVRIVKISGGGNMEAVVIERR